MKKIFLLAFIVLIIASISNAELTLTINGVDAVEPQVIGSRKDLIIAVAGINEAETQDISVTADGGKLELLTKTELLEDKPTSVKYLFNFIDESDLGIISLNVNGKLVYQLILFSVPEENKTIAFGIDADAIEIPEPEPDSEAEQIALQFPYDSNIVPYAQRKEQEKEESLKFCPSGQGLIPAKGKLSAKESKSREIPTGSGYGSMLMGGESIIDVNSDIILNTVWTSDNTYHIIADVNVQALLVIEPGTTIYFGYDNYAAMFINNGGTLISCGTPDNPIVYTSDSGTPGYDDYYCPMYIEETASANTKIMYSCVEYAYIGAMILNNELETDIQNNYFYSNVYGIVEFGKKHTNIRNNLLVASYYSGIEVFLGDSTGEGSADSSILIEDNTCDYYQDNGITIHGVEDVNEAGVVVLANNIVSGSYQYGMALVDYYMYATVMNTGYFDNANNKNGAFDEDSPAFETVLPYEMGTGTLPVCYLRQDCNFVNAGSFLIEQTPLIGQTTAVNSIPDYNYVDIGFHYPNWNFSNPGSGDSLSADFDDSMRVDFQDFATFANYWQQSTGGDADLDGSGFVDYNDLLIFKNQWLQIADPNIEIHIYGDSNEGYVDIGISGFMSDTQRVFLLADGKYIGELYWFREGEPLLVDISSLGPGTHWLKAISTSTTGRITCSKLKESTFNCFLNYYFCNDAYDSNEPHHFCAYYQGSNDISVKVYDEENNLVWSQTYSGPNLHGFIPSGVTLSENLDSIIFEEVGARGTPVSKPLGLKFNPKKVPANIRALIIVPSWWMRHVTNYGVIETVKDAFKSRNVPYHYLKGSQASYASLAWFGANRNIDYIYFCGHGGYGRDPDTGEYYFGTIRSEIKLSDGRAVSVKQSDFPPGQAPSWCEKLSGNWENTVHSMYQIGFTQGELKFVFFDACFTGRLKLTGDSRLVEGPPGQQGLFALPHSDMSWALKMVSGETQVFQGWWGERPGGFTSKFNKFCVHEWTKLKEGAHLYDALVYAINETDWIPNGPHDNYRLKGQGYFTELRIE